MMIHRIDANQLQQRHPQQHPYPTKQSEPLNQIVCQLDKKLVVVCRDMAWTISIMQICLSDSNEDELLVLASEQSIDVSGETDIE